MVKKKVNSAERLYLIIRIIHSTVSMRNDEFVS